MGCCPVAVVKMHVHEYEIRSKTLKWGGLHEKHAVTTWETSQHSLLDTGKPDDCLLTAELYMMW
jgi:hypothetical protein